MVEKTKTMSPEPGPSATIYERHARIRKEFIERQNTGKLLVKSSEREFQTTRQGRSKYYLCPTIWPENALQDWAVLMQDLVLHTGKHRHQGGLIIFILEGRGYTVVEGQRMDWKKGDLVALPLLPGGVEHQHYNLEPGKPCRWIAFIYTTIYDQTGSFTEQIELSPLYSGPKTS
ncbi:MAG: cupin domain-containing protein [Chloroflexi bacterium]|nr:cupin domain-containing protein [Chloroflexota bacterium]